MDKKIGRPRQGAHATHTIDRPADIERLTRKDVNGQLDPQPMDPAMVSPEDAAEAMRTGKRLPPVTGVPEPRRFFTDTDDRNPAVVAALLPSLEVSRSTSKVQSTFKNLRLIVDTDPVFRRIARYDRATGELRHAEKYHGIDAMFADLAEYLAELYNIESTIPKLEWIATRQGHLPENQFNSIIEAINETPAPTINPIDDIVESFQLENPDDARFVRETFDLWLKKAALQIAVPEATGGKLVYPNDVIIVLHGPQGIGKTLLSSNLAINANLYLDVGAEKLDELGSRDGMMKLAGLDIAELGEYRSPKTLEVIKSLASATRHKYRPPYARGNVDIPRTVNFIATTNTRHYLTDGTGNRRFYPVNLVDVDRSIFEDREQFAELRSYYFRWAVEFIESAGDDLSAALFTVRESDELAQHLMSAREAVRHVDSTEEVIEGYFDTVRQAVATGDYSKMSDTRTTQAHYREYYSALEAVTLIYPHGRHPNNFYRTFTEVAIRDGLEQQKIRIGGRRIRAWVVPENSDSGTGPGTTQGVTNGKDLRIGSNGGDTGVNVVSIGFKTGGGTGTRDQGNRPGGTRI